MGDMTLRMTVGTMTRLHQAKEAVHERVVGQDPERGEGVVGYLLALLLVIAGVAVVRPVILGMLQDEANNIDLDLSSADPAPDQG